MPMSKPVQIQTQTLDQTQSQAVIKVEVFTPDGEHVVLEYREKSIRDAILSVQGVVAVLVLLGYTCMSAMSPRDIIYTASCFKSNAMVRFDITPSP